MRRIHIFCLSVLILIPFFFYWHTLDNKIFFDDSYVLSLVPHIRPTLFSFSDLHSWQYLNPINHLSRYVMLLTFRFIDFLTADQSWQRFFNILVHTLNSALLYSLIFKLFKSWKTAFFVSLFFVLNPASVHAVSYLTQRSILLCVFFGLLSTLSILACIRERSNFKSIFYFFIFLILMILCTGSKEQGIVFSFFLPIFTIVFNRCRRNLIYCAIFFLPIFYSIFKSSSFPSITDGSGRNFDLIVEACGWSGLSQGELYIRSIYTQSLLFFKYILIWFFPLNTSIDMRSPLRESFFLIFPFLFVLVSGFIMLFRKKSNKNLAVAIIISCLFFLPEFSIIRLGEIFVVYRSYMYIGFMLLVACLIDSFWSFKSKTLHLLPFLIFIPMSLISYQRIRMFDREVLLWGQAESQLQEDVKCQGARIYQNLSVALLAELSDAKDKLKNLTFAKHFAEESLKIHPTAALDTLGNVQEFIGFDTEASQTFKKIVDNPKSHTVQLCAAYTGIGNLALKKGDIKKALENYDKADKIHIGCHSAKQNLKMIKDSQKKS